MATLWRTISDLEIATEATHLESWERIVDRDVFGCRTIVAIQGLGWLVAAVVIVRDEIRTPCLPSGRANPWAYVIL